MRFESPTHSIAVGMLGNEGVLPATYVYDLSPLFAKVRRPRQRWLDHESGEDIGPVTDWRLVALFEIGRRLHRQGFDGRLRTSTPLQS